MTSSAKKFREKYEYSANNEKNKLSRTKKAIAGLGLAVTMSTTLLSGCTQKNSNVKEGIHYIVEPTKEDGKQYTDKEQKQIKKLLQRKDEFLDKVKEEYNHIHSSVISTNEIDVLKITNLYAFSRNGKYFIDQEKDAYKGCSQISRDKGDSDLIVLDKKNNKILFTISQINGALHETYIFGYYDEKQVKRYINDKSYGTIINSKYTIQKCFEGAEALVKYRQKEQYQEWEKYNEYTNSSIALER